MSKLIDKGIRIWLGIATALAVVGWYGVYAEYREPPQAIQFDERGELINKGYNRGKADGIVTGSQEARAEITEQLNQKLREAQEGMESKCAQLQRAAFQAGAQAELKDLIDKKIGITKGPQ